MFRKRNERGKSKNCIYLLMVNLLKGKPPQKKRNYEVYFLQYDKYIILEKLDKKKWKKIGISGGIKLQ